MTDQHKRIKSSFLLSGCDREAHYEHNKAKGWKEERKLDKPKGGQYEEVVGGWKRLIVIRWLIQGLFLEGWFQFTSLWGQEVSDSLGLLQD